ncbi:unnamed protein product [Closterium sp. NIES-54]
MVTTTTPGGQRVSICTCTWTGRHLATFTCQPRSNLCSCRLLSHQTLLWHHRLGHPSLPRLCGMHSRLLVSGIPRSLPPLPLSPAPPCLPCVEGRQRAAPHSSSFPPTTSPLQILHMDVWGPASVSEQGRERYFLLVVDDYTRYTMLNPLRSKGEVPDVLIPWNRAVHLQLRERFSQDLPVMRLHTDRGGHFSSDLQSFTLPASPQQNGIAERRIGLVIEVACTSMIHAVAPHFLWPFAVWYAAHQLNLWPRVSLSETSPTLRWTGKVGDVSVFWVRGSRAFVRDTSVDKLYSRAIPCDFLGFNPDTPGWQFYHPTSRCVLPSQDTTFDELVPFYCLFPYCTAPLPPPPLFLAPGPHPVDPLPPQGPAPSGVPQVEPLPLAVPVEVAVDSGAARGAASGGAASGGAEPAIAEPGGAEPEGVDPGGAEPRGTASAGGPTGASPRVPHQREPLSPQQLREWFAQRTRVRSGVAGAEGSTAGATWAGGVRGAGAGDPGARGTRAGDPRAGGTRVGGARDGGAGASNSGGVGVTVGAGGTGGAGAAGPGGARTGGTGAGDPRAGGTGAGDPGARGAGAGDAGAGDPIVGGAGAGGTGAGGAGTRGTRAGDPGAGGACAGGAGAGGTGARGTSTAAPALVAELVDFASACCLDYPTSLVAESESDCPPSVGGECALGTDVLEDKQEEFECLAATVPHLVAMRLAPEGEPDAPDIPTLRSYSEAIEGPYSSQWQTAMDTEMTSWKSTGTYVDAVPPSGANIGVEFFQAFFPTPKMTTLQVLLHVTAQRDYELHSLDFSTAFLQGSLHEEIWLRRPPGFTGSFPAGTQTSLAALGFAPLTADPSLFLRTDTSLPPFYILVYIDDLVFATADTEALALVKSELQKRHTCTDLGELHSYLGLQITRDRAPRTITLTQSHMVHQVLQRFGFRYSSPQSTPLPTGHSL